MLFRPISLSRQISYLSFAFATVLLVVLGAFGWWAASSIDDRAMARQSRAVERGLAEIVARIPVEQDGSAVWDDAVVNLRAGNEAWIADNLAEWMSDYFGHDRIYILDANDVPIRAVVAAQLIDDSDYYRDEGSLGPLVSALRAQLAERAGGSADAVEATGSLGLEDIIVLSDGQPAIVSIRPILPSSAAVTQRAGDEYLHISIRLCTKIQYVLALKPANRCRSA